MTKARIPTHEERLAESRRKMAFREAIKHAHRVSAAPGVEENPDPVQLDEYHCPVCDGELTRWEGCYRCKKCGWSKC